MNRQEILKAAEDCVCRDRQATHGAPENSFGKLAAVWSARLGINITPAHAAILLSDLKTVRAWDNPGHADNWVDGAGYMACGGELAAAVKKSLTTQQPSKEPKAKPMFAVGQVWETRDGETRYEITSVDAPSNYKIVGTRKDIFRDPETLSWTIVGLYWSHGEKDNRDLVRLIYEPENAA